VYKSQLRVAAAAKRCGGAAQLGDHHL
jgi:hypothetical protein